MLVRECVSLPCLHHAQGFYGSDTSGGTGSRGATAAVKAPTPRSTRTPADAPSGAPATTPRSSSMSLLSPRASSSRLVSPRGNRNTHLVSPRANGVSLMSPRSDTSKASRRSGSSHSAMVTAGEKEGGREAGAAAAAAGTGSWGASKVAEGKGVGKGERDGMWDSIRILRCPVDRVEVEGEGGGDSSGVAMEERVVYLIGTAHVSKVRRDRHSLVPDWGKLLLMITVE